MADFDVHLLVPVGGLHRIDVVIRLLVEIVDRLVEASRAHGFTYEYVAFSLFTRQAAIVVRQASSAEGPGR